MKDSSLVITVGVLMLLLGGGYAVYTATRGLRNNNPGNIVYDPNVAWEGLATPPSDGKFAVFINPTYGIRALAVTLETYASKYGLNTVDGIINRWAPPTENDTEAYKKDVAAELGVTSSTPLNMTASGDLPNLVTAIIRHENGGSPYSAADVNSAIALA